ncbi:hypothetical protein F5Y03DRAFT_84939 [Xylaria venustula]|nr:hypothetical protein F5Y03DRAFT_84939 [Xylaria venustula]
MQTTKTAEVTTMHDDRSSCLVEEECRGIPVRSKPICFIINQPSRYALYRIHALTFSSKYTIDSRNRTPYRTPWDSRYPMPTHHYHSTRSMFSGNEKGKGPAIATWPATSDSHVVFPGNSRRLNPSHSTLAQSQTSANPLIPEGNNLREKYSSNTWTSSSDNPDLPSGEEEKDDREQFVLQYNRLAQRHGIRPLVPGDFSPVTERVDGSQKSRQGSWISKMLRQASEQPEQPSTKLDKPSLRYQRSFSDAALHFAPNHKRDELKNRDLIALIRLCGKSRFYLPADYAPFSLTLPTCLRALAQALIQHADTKGIFRVPGSARVINALYEYYWTDDDIDAVSSTTRCPTLPMHIRCNTHDIASTFKRFLAGLPGGILGSLSLFDALVAIHSQLQGDAESRRTKESKLRARLIALAIGTVRSQHQRELICAVFGLLCLVGRIAENAPREDEHGRPLPTTDLMGYNALGIVFGPLLIGDMIDEYSMKVADPSAGLVLLPISPPRSRKERHKHKHRHRHRPSHKHSQRHVKKHAPVSAPTLSVDKIHIANSITEMLIIHWREVVRQIRSTGSMKTGRIGVSSSISGNTSLQTPSHLNHAHPRSVSSSTASPTPVLGKPSNISSEQHKAPDLYPPHARQASSISSSGSTRKHSAKGVPQVLSPTIEESPSPHIDALEPIYDSRRANDNDIGNLDQNTYHVSSETHLSPVYGGSFAGSVDRHEPIAGPDTAISQPAPSLGTRTSESPLPLSPVQKKRTLIVPYLDVVPLGSGLAGDIATSKVNSSPSSRTDPSSSFLSSPQVTPQHGHDPVTPNHTAHQAMPCDYRTGACSIHSNDEGMGETGSGLAQTAGKTVGPGETNPLDARLRDSNNGDDPGNMRLSPSSAQPRLRTGGNQKGIESPDLGYPRSGNSRRTHLDSETRRSPADQWRNLLASSKASTESLAKLAKERRLKRNTDHIAARANREASDPADTGLAASEWKEQLSRNGYDLKGKLIILRSERKSVLEDTLLHKRPDLEIHRNQISSEKYSTNTNPKGIVQRSASKPMPGAVKAMAALFDSAAKESPDTPPDILNRRTRPSIRESERFPYRGVFDESPTKPKQHRGAIASTKRIELDENSRQRGPIVALTPEKRHPTPRSGISTIRTAPNRPKIEHTPTKSVCSTLKPVKTFSSARKEPQSLQNKPTNETDRNQRLRLGTMIPHEEEPPIDHFVRPSSAISAQSQTAGAEEFPLLTDGPGPRQTSGTSYLHAQIRSLQRQLALRGEEILQLRRRLETQEHMDIGTLSEQLRFAKRECMTWRKRAEAAERRVAVFQRLGSRFEAFRDGAVDDDRDDCYCHVVPDGRARGDYMADDTGSSVHTESREAFNSRIRNIFAANARGDGVLFEDRVEDAGDGFTGGYQLCSGKPPRTLKSWEAARDILDLQRRDGMYILRREHASC